MKPHSRCYHNFCSLINMLSQRNRLNSWFKNFLAFAELREMASDGLILRLQDAVNRELVSRTIQAVLDELPESVRARRASPFHRLQLIWLLELSRRGEIAQTPASIEEELQRQEEFEAQLAAQEALEAEEARRAMQAEGEGGGEGSEAGNGLSAARGADGNSDSSSDDDDDKERKLSAYERLMLRRKREKAEAANAAAAARAQRGSGPEPARLKPGQQAVVGAMRGQGRGQLLQARARGPSGAGFRPGASAAGLPSVEASRGPVERETLDMSSALSGADVASASGLPGASGASVAPEAPDSPDAPDTQKLSDSKESADQLDVGDFLASGVLTENVVCGDTVSRGSFTGISTLGTAQGDGRVTVQNGFLSANGHTMYFERLGIGSSQRR